MTQRGEQLPWTKLTEADVIAIRALVEERRRCLDRAAELTTAKLAQRFGVHESCIYKIASRCTWGHV